MQKNNHFSTTQYNPLDDILVPQDDSLDIPDPDPRRQNYNQNVNVDMNNNHLQGSSQSGHRLLARNIPATLQGQPNASDTRRNWDQNNNFGNRSSQNNPSLTDNLFDTEDESHEPSK